MTSLTRIIIRDNLQPNSNQAYSCGYSPAATSFRVGFASILFASTLRKPIAVIASHVNPSPCLEQTVANSGNTYPRYGSCLLFMVQIGKMLCKRSSVLEFYHERNTWNWFILNIVFILAFWSSLVSTTHEHLCLEDDYTNDLPIFIEKRRICNFDLAPVHVYSIKLTPDTDYETKLCLKGEFAETFSITKENELILSGRLEQTETNLKLQIIRTANDIIGTPGERRQAINAIQFILIIDDCNQVSWQTIVVAVLSSLCLALMSSLAIMLILYQQKGCIKLGNEEDRADDLPYPAGDLRDESFINPRRTSSYEFTSLSKQSECTLERQDIKDL